MEPVTLENYGELLHFKREFEKSKANGHTDERSWAYAHYMLSIHRGNQIYERNVDAAQRARD